METVREQVGGVESDDRPRSLVPLPHLQTCLLTLDRGRCSSLSVNP